MQTKIIDAHAHIFPDRIAVKAAANIGSFYDIPMRYDGTVSTLLELGKRNGVDRFLVQSVATTPEQVESINDFIASQVEAFPDRLIGFAALHPDYPHIGREVDRVISMGLRGIKIHPDFQRFQIDSPAAMKLYEAIEGRLPILVHTGDSRYDFSGPSRMGRVLDRFPRLDAICAHLGGWSEWDDAARELAGRRVWVDTSSSLYALTPERAREIIGLFGEDNVLFGTDYPMWDPGEELGLLDRLGLDEKVKEKLLHLNVERLLKL